MKIHALEEHFLTPAAREAQSRLEPEYQDPTPKLFDAPELNARLGKVVERRFSRVDEIKFRPFKKQKHL